MNRCVYIYICTRRISYLRLNTLWQSVCTSSLTREVVRPGTLYHSTHEIKPNNEYGLLIGCLTYVITLMKLALVL